jgi:hypothetical protein
MIVILPTGTGFLVGTLPIKEKKNRLHKLPPKPKKETRKLLADYWTGVREWMHSTNRSTN